MSAICCISRARGIAGIILIRAKPQAATRYEPGGARVLDPPASPFGLAAKRRAETPYYFFASLSITMSLTATSTSCPP